MNKTVLLYTIWSAILYIFCWTIVHAQETKPAHIAGGLMQGHTTTENITVWFLTKYAQEIRLQLSLKDTLVTDTTLQWQATKAIDNYYSVTHKFEQLTANTTYKYKIWLNNKLSQTGEIKTNSPEVIKDFSFLIASCSFVPTQNKEKIWIGIGPKTYRQAAKTSADFMVWLGDNLYLRDGDWNSYEGIFRRYIHSRTYEPINELLRSKPQYATWDDHDFGPNNAKTHPKYRDTALQAFKTFWANPSYGTSTTKGVFTHFSYGDADFFLLDERYYKQQLNDTTGYLLGKEQWAWFLNKLEESTATFKFVVGGSQFINTLNLHKYQIEGFKEFTNEYNRLFKEISERDIKGIIFLSGDRHFSELYRYPRKDNYDLWEITSSSIGSHTISFPPFPISSPKNPHAVKRTKYWPTNFGKISITGKAGERICTVNIINKYGKIVWSKAWHEEELR